MNPYLTELNHLMVGTYQSILKVEEVMLRDLSKSRLTISEMHMLECIGADPANQPTITAVAQMLEITPPSATVAIKRLEKKGYVTKERCPDDARRVHVHLTKEGHRAEIAHRYFHRQMVRAITNTMDEQEKQILLRSVRKLQTFLHGQIEGIEKRQSEGGENP